MSFYNKYLMLCNSVGKTPSAVALEIGFSKSTVSRWKAGQSANDATLQKVADYFGCSLDDLTADPGQKETPTLEEKSELNKDALLDLIANADAAELRKALSAISKRLGEL